MKANVKEKSGMSKSQLQQQGQLRKHSGEQPTMSTMSRGISRVLGKETQEAIEKGVDQGYEDAFRRIGRMLGEFVNQAPTSQISPVKAFNLLQQCVVAFGFGLADTCKVEHVMASSEGLYQRLLSIIEKGKAKERAIVRKQNGA